MSKINPGLYSSQDHTWMTPPELIDTVLKFEGVDRFTMDAACSEPNVPAMCYLTPDGCRSHNWELMDDVCGLTSCWGGLVWVNPPYGKLLQKFIQKAYEESQEGCRVWMLIPARTETRYQHDYGLTKAGFTVFLKGRLHFLHNGEDKGSAPFPTMLLYYGDDWEEKARRWVKEQPIPGTLMVRY